MRSEQSDEQSAEQLQEVKHRKARIAHRGIRAIPDTIFGSHKIEMAIDFVGFSVPNLFVVGYGTDFAEKYRHLPYIGAIE